MAHWTISWRQQGSMRIIAGMSRYRTERSAREQLAQWQQLWPSTTYYLHDWL